MPQNLVAAEAATSPSGLPVFVWPAVVIVVAGAGIYAGYRAYTQTRLAEANASVESVRVRSEASVQIVRAQLDAKLQARAQSLAYAMKTGTFPPPSPLEDAPIQIPDLNPDVRQASGWSTLEVVGAVAGGMAASGLGVWASTFTTRDRRPW